MIIVVLLHTFEMYYIFVDDPQVVNNLKDSVLYKEVTPEVGFIFRPTLSVKNLLLLFQLTTVLSVCYGISIYFAVKSWSYLQRNLKLFCLETRELNRNIARVMIVQVTITLK